MSAFTEHDIDVFNQELYVAAQNKGGVLRPRVRRKTGVEGVTAYFPKIGSAPAAMPKTRNGNVPLLSIARTRESCTLTDYYGADLIDVLDELRTNVDQRNATQDAITMSLGRKEDDVITAELVTGSNANDNTASNDSFSSDATPRAILEYFGDAEIMDGDGMHALIKWKAWNDLLALNSFINSQYGGDTRLTSEGQLPKMYFGFAYAPFSRLPAHSSGNKYNLWFNQKVIGEAVGAEVQTMIERIPEKDAWQIMGKMRIGSVLIDDTGVIKRRYG